MPVTVIMPEINVEGCVNSLDPRKFLTQIVYQRGEVSMSWADEAGADGAGADATSATIFEESAQDETEWAEMDRICGGFAVPRRATSSGAFIRIGSIREQSAYEPSSASEYHQPPSHHHRQY